jgi:hypothetical protein
VVGVESCGLLRILLLHEGRRAVQDIQFSRLQAGDLQALVDGQVGDIAVPDRNVGEIQLKVSTA